MANHTLRGSGWLRESPINFVPAEWLRIRSRSAMRKCIFLPAPRIPVFERDVATLLDPPRAFVGSARAKGASAPAQAIGESARRVDPMRRARQFPAVDLAEVRAFDAMRRDAMRREPMAPRPATEASVPAWWDAPIVMGIMLVLLPPAGLAAVWTRADVPREGKWALTGVTMFFMALVTVLVLSLRG